MPLLLALLSSVFWGGSDFLGGTMTRRLPALLVVGASQLIGGICVVALALAREEFDAPLRYLPWGVAAGLVGALALVAFYAALAAGTMGVVAPIAALGAVVPVLAGLGQGERPDMLQLAGIGIAILGVVLASGPELSGASGPRPVVLAVFAAVGFGFALFFLFEGSKTSPLMTAVTMRAASVPVIAVLLVTVFRPTGARLSRRDLPLIALIGIGDVAANLAFAEASTGELVSIVAVLGSLYPVVTVLLARVIHGERLAGVQNLGIVLALGGVALIASG
jgi:drug/metabolite transporter (DMT)-like permease